MASIIASQAALNAICPYFTMFPLEFPRRILARHARAGQRVLDPFCGRGTTNFAARLAGLETLGVDSNPVAVAITAAKLATTDVKAVMSAARRILATTRAATIPQGEFWERAFHPAVLRKLCRFRAGLLTDCRSSARKVLRGIILGALHGPLGKETQSYFSNQCTRTYAPKPGYAVKYWRANRLRAPSIDLLEVIRRRAERFLVVSLPEVTGMSRLGDSRIAGAVIPNSEKVTFDWVITSPPYYGMRTYVQDQWLRNWFLGGPDSVDYSVDGQLAHMSPEAFGAQLSQVWANVADVCSDEAKLVIRFGGIRNRNAEPLDIIKSSLHNSAWRISTVHDAGSADAGKRQADSFLIERSTPMTEYDVWARIG
jgi:hypothetical protein